MQFGKTLDKVLSGEKTATSRIVKPGDCAITEPGLNTFGDEIAGVTHISEVRRNNRTIYRVGQEVAIQPGRGQKSVGRICITALDRYDPRLITPEQVQAEGFSDVDAFLAVWCGMHDPPFAAIARITPPPRCSQTPGAVGRSVPTG